MKNAPSNILISRTDSIGDVVLTLPVAAVLKKQFPQIKIGFMGRAYTKPVIEACKYIDEFIDADDFMHNNITIGGEKPEVILHVFPVSSIAKRAKQLNIPIRIGTTNRLYHRFTCNRLVKLSRKNSPLHEAQLNLKLLKAFDIDSDFSLEEIGHLFGLEKLQPLPAEFTSLIDRNKYNLVLHPKSQGSGREWPVDNFIQLIRSLDKEKYQIFISGTQKEQHALKPLFEEVGHLVTDITGKMTLPQFMSFINQCNGLIASSTGPLHIAGALGKDAFGIYPSIRPLHPGRWRPLGDKAQVFVLQKDCNDCKKNPSACKCMMLIEPILLKEALDKVSSAIV